jgi:plastocyanin
MTRSIRAVTALFGVAALVSACGSAGTSAPAATTSAPAATTSAPAATAAQVNIDVQGFKFPPNMDVAKGTKVTWTNKDTTKHTVTSGTRPTRDGKFDGQIDAAGTFSFTFTDTGTYQYFCSIHSSMNGTITVK